MGACATRGRHEDVRIRKVDGKPQSHGAGTTIEDLERPGTVLTLLVATKPSAQLAAARRTRCQQRARCSFWR